MSTTLVADAGAFFTRLEADNTREFWQTERAIYEQELRPQFTTLVEGLAGFAAWRIYRPHNDTRFQRDKGPYKTFIGAVSERPDGVGAFVQISKRGLLVGTGMPMPASDQLPRLRTALGDDVTGVAFVAAVQAVEQAGATVHGGRYEPLKRVPKPFSADHPRATYLCWKGVEINYRLATVEWPDLAAGAAAITALIAQAEPLHAWLAATVGPSGLTPEERFAPKRRA